MIGLIDMASSPQYLAPSAHTPEHIEIDSNTTVLPDGSGSIAQPTTVAYSHPEQSVYSEISHVSPFGTSPLGVDDNLLTPVSSAASPPLQPKIKSLYDHDEDSLHYSQQPTPPHNANMYSAYSDYMHATSQATSSMSMQSVAAEASHDFFLQNSPGPDDGIPPPQPKLYLGAFSVSNVSAAPEPDPYPGYSYSSGMDSPMGVLRHASLPDINPGSYTHQPLNHSSMSSLLHHSPQDPYRRIPPLPRLSPTHHTTIRPQSTRGQPGRKAARRRRATPPNALQAMYRIDEAAVPVMIEDDGPAEEVTLDDKAPSDLQRLWDIRKKHLSRKGNGMWEDIMTEYYQEENLASENKKTQLKAGLQMKIHRMLLKHGVWPKRDESALRRAYKRWEENRYIEILRLFEEEMAGRKKAYDWKSQHVEAQLVKMGLEEPERDRESKARKRKQVAARQQARSSAGAAATARQRLPPASAYHDQQSSGPYYGQPSPAPATPGHHHYRASSYDANQALVQELGAQPPELDDAAREQLVSQVLERGTPYDLIEHDSSSDHQPPTDPRLSEYPPPHHNPHHHHSHSHHHHAHQEQAHGLPMPPWETRPRTTSTSLIHPALTGANNSPALSQGVYPPAPGTPGAHSSSASNGGANGHAMGSPEFDAHRASSITRSGLEETLSRPAYT